MKHTCLVACPHCHNLLTNPPIFTKVAAQGKPPFSERTYRCTICAAKIEVIIRSTEPPQKEFDATRHVKSAYTYCINCRNQITIEAARKSPFCDDCQKKGITKYA